MSKHGDVWKNSDNTIELRCGDWREVLADVKECDAVITDPPFSERVHKNARSTGKFLRGEVGEGIEAYVFWSEEEVEEAIASWNGICKSWIVVHTDDIIGPAFRSGAEDCGRYAFPLLPILMIQVRIAGDGPASHGHYLSVSRPREKRFRQWGSLPGFYIAARDKLPVIGGKPISLMRNIVRDYSRTGDLIVDPCAGGGTTLLAAAMEGRRSIGAEIDPDTFDKAVNRLSGGYTRTLGI